MNVHTHLSKRGKFDAYPNVPQNTNFCPILGHSAPHPPPHAEHPPVQYLSHSPPMFVDLKTPSRLPTKYRISMLLLRQEKLVDYLRTPLHIEITNHMYARESPLLLQVGLMVVVDRIELGMKFAMIW